MCLHLWETWLYFLRMIAGIFYSIGLGVVLTTASVALLMAGWAVTGGVVIATLGPSWWMEDAEEVTVLREISSLWPFSLAF